jgi:hypothetical protein
MSVPDMIRNMSKFAEKAKDLPLHMLQTALSGVGQALLLGDRVRTRIKGLAGQEEDLDESRKETAVQLPDSEEKVEEKPARRAPVIFAPRPEKAAAKATTSESNGTKASEPVIFTPAKPAATETPDAKPAEALAPEAVPAEPAKAAEALAPEAAEVKAVEADAPAAETPEVKAAEADAPAAETRPAAPETSAPKVVEAEASIPAPAAPEAGAAEAAAPEAGPKIVEDSAPEVEIAAPPARKARAPRAKATDTEVAKAGTADAAVVEVTETQAAEPAVDRPLAEAVTVPAEPMPGYSELTVASLRARMRGKTAAQIQELIAYERATSARDTVVRMYENRLAKLEAAE